MVVRGRSLYGSLAELAPNIICGKSSWRDKKARVLQPFFLTLRCRRKHESSGKESVSADTKLPERNFAKHFAMSAASPAAPASAAEEDSGEHHSSDEVRRSSV